MSYNVTNWRNKELENLVILMGSFYCEREDWRPNRYNRDDGSAQLKWGEKSVIEGIVIDDKMHVREISFSGECSGSALYHCVEDALRHSSGRLRAIRIWEGGDYIDEITVQDGMINTREIDL